MTEATSYTELMAAIQCQVEAMNLRLADFDDLAGFPAGLSGKVFGLLQVKRLGPEKLFDALRAAGLKLRVEVDPEQRAKMLERISENYLPRQANQARNRNHASPVGTAVLSRIFTPLARKGGKAAMAKKTKEELREHQQMAANARWKRHRKKKKKQARQSRAAHKARKQA